MLFYNQKTHIHYKNLLYAGDVIERIGGDCKTKSFKFLGTLIDDQLSWPHHLFSLKTNLTLQILPLHKSNIYYLFLLGCPYMKA